MTVLEQALEGTKSVAILGHVRPDGDCLGSTLGLYNYLLASYPDIQAAVYLEEASSKFAYLKGYDEIHHETDDKEYELCICLDSSDEERLGDFNVYLKRAKKSLCIDHHITNTRYCQINLVAADASSASEVLFEQLNQVTQEKAMQPVKEVLAVLPLSKENNKENNTEKTGIEVLMNDNSQYSGTIFFMGVDEAILNREEKRKLLREIGIIEQTRII